MQIIPESNELEILENRWIPMRDGTRLAARLWLPEGANINPVPVVLEYIPYRKRDITRIEDNALQSFIARRGIAVARVDIRGTGDSEGVIHDEYSDQELRDALDIIEWLAEQSWSTGKIGMKGISWGGINALQVAALNPGPLKAIVTYCSTDHRFRTDAHYLGGVLTRSNFDWGAWFQTVLALPPDPEVVGDNWKTMWQQRLDHLSCPVLDWLKHSHDDDYWAHGSVDRDYSKIRCPVYAVGGFVDAYTDTVPSLLENLTVPRKGLIGPWGHHYPDRSDPGPAIGFMHEEVRWWNHWLKGIDTGIMQEPMLAVYMGDTTPGESYPADVPGRWVAEELWPSRRLEEQRFYLLSTGLSGQPGEEQALSLQPDESTGLQKRHLLPMFIPGQLPTQQQSDDEKSLYFDSRPLTKVFETLGIPQVRLQLSVDRLIAKVAVRLQEVDAHGQSWHVTAGFLNLNLKDNFREPQPLIPGKRYNVTLDLGFVAHRFRRGNRIRLSISEAYWPKLHPSPQPVCLTLYTGLSELRLPVRPDSHNPMLENLTFPPALRSVERQTQLDAPEHTCNVIQTDTEIGVHECLSSGLYRLDEIDTVVSQINRSDSTIRLQHNRTVEWHNQCQVALCRGDWDIRLEVNLRLESDEENYRLYVSCEAYNSNDLIFQTDWQEAQSREIGLKSETINE